MREAVDTEQANAVRAAEAAEPTQEVELKQPHRFHPIYERIKQHEMDG